MAGVSAVAVAAAAAGALALWSDSSPAPTRDGSFALIQTTSRWPHETLQDWASYADQLSVISVTDEWELPPPEVGTTGGYVGRKVTIRVDETLWHRPGAPEAARTFDMFAYGWLETDGARRPITMEGGKRLEVGERYLAPLLLSDDGEWSILGSEALVTVSGERMTSQVDVGQPSRALMAVRDHSIHTAATLLRTTPPDPAAKKYSELPPEARWNAASRESP